MDEKIKLVVALAQQLVDTHQIITVGTHETAAVRIKDIERLRDALEEMDELKRRDAALSSSSPCRHAAEADALRTRCMNVVYIVSLIQRHPGDSFGAARDVSGYLLEEKT